MQITPGPKLRLTSAVVLVALIGGTLRAWAQVKSSPAPAPADQQAVSIVIRRYSINPLVKDPNTGQPLPRNGSWFVDKDTPPSCPKTQETCVGVFYQVPAESVRCSWVVLLNANGTDGTFLDENQDAARYMVRMVSEDEATTVIRSRDKPLYPAIAQAAHISGVVAIDVLVDRSGNLQKALVVSGPPMLLAAALEAAKSWRFKPLVVGSQGLPYMVQLAFSFHTNGPGLSSVEMAP